MLTFVCRDKCGFSTTDNVVKIYDNNNVLFYFKENRNGKLYFNLPRGKYKTYNNLFKCKPRQYKKHYLPKPNKRKKLPENFEIKYINNPNKCSVDNKNHIIYFDNSFKRSPLPIKDYIKFHELGHYFYSGEGNRSEICCDIFAANCMLKIGYNPSQVKWAQNGTLSNEVKTSRIRKNEINKRVKNSFL